MCIHESRISYTDSPMCLHTHVHSWMQGITTQWQLHILAYTRLLSLTHISLPLFSSHTFLPFFFISFFPLFSPHLLPAVVRITGLRGVDFLESITNVEVIPVTVGNYSWVASTSTGNLMEIYFASISLAFMLRIQCWSWQINKTKFYPFQRTSIGCMEHFFTYRITPNHFLAIMNLALAEIFPTEKMQKEHG